MHNAGNNRTRGAALKFIWNEAVSRSLKPDSFNFRGRTDGKTCYIPQPCVFCGCDHEQTVTHRMFRRLVSARVSAETTVK
jgi:hypothetical protein